MDEQHYEYRTGRTEPRPKHYGIIAFLLILVIFLAGLVSVMGVMNIRLTRLLADEQEDTPLSFDYEQEQTLSETDEGMVFAGMNIHEIPHIYQQMCDLPHGLYIESVQDGSRSHEQGILAGDVLVSLSGAPVSSLKDLKFLLSQSKGSVTLTVYRDGQQTDFTVEVSN